ncbi:MAG TPA: OstA-like protein [Saprospiraceae bacterium]|nr:OstA-like protein [Saprospiraceae bacterium]HNT20587.1 OstA-like protein [Saprospiraceae bacterium]
MYRVPFLFVLNILLLSGIPSDALAQAGAAGEQQIKILHSDYTFLDIEPGLETKILKGDVQLYHDSSFLYCDSARIVDLLVYAYGNVVIRHNDTVQIFADSIRYNGLDKAADLYGEVILVSGSQSLFTRKLHYDLNASVASYHTPATLKSKETVLKSQRGYYFVQEDLAHFAGQVQLVDPEIQLRSDSLQFNTKTQTAYFTGPTLMERQDRTIYCEGGFYDVDDKQARFTGNPQFQEKDKKASSEVMLYDGLNGQITLFNQVKYLSEKETLEGDSLYYNENTRIMTLLGEGMIRTEGGTVRSSKKLVYHDSTGVFITEGRSVLQDSSNYLEADLIEREAGSEDLKARGAVYWTDTLNRVDIHCDSLHFNKRENRVVATGKGRQPLFKSFDNPADTLFLRADTLVAYQADTLRPDKSIKAYHRVTVFRSDLQARCDSLSYHQKDSVFTLYHDPVIWSDTSQFFADTIRLLQSGNEIKSIYLLQNAMIINSPDLRYFNQIKGRRVRADFDSSELATVDVLGNAEAVYYILDDDRAYIGVNKIICSNILVKFGNNQVDRIYFFTEPNGTMYPMRKADHEALKLKGFKWLDSERPTYTQLVNPGEVNLQDRN